MTRSLFEVSRRASAVAMTLAALAFSASCGKSMMQQGDGSSYLIVGSLQAASGSTPAAFSAVLQSSASAPNDLGQVKLRMALKDTVSSLTPTDSNTITITSYDIAFENLTAGYAVPAPVTSAGADREHLDVGRDPDVRPRADADEGRSGGGDGEHQGDLPRHGPGRALGVGHGQHLRHVRALDRTGPGGG